MIARYKMIVVIVSLLALLSSAFSMTGSIDSVGQRRDGSKLVDIWFTIDDFRDCVDVSFSATTLNGEELISETFAELSDTGTICSAGSYHIIWDFGVDVPNREFFTDSIMLLMTVAYPGVVPGECPMEIMITGSESHSIAIRSDKTVWSWGNNTNGRLGDGTETTSFTPVQVVGAGGIDVLSDIIEIDNGRAFNIALCENGFVWAWGNNTTGQLGDGTTTNRRTPERVRNADGTGFLENIIAIASGWYHGIAIDSAGYVWTWGGNDFGQLGDGTTTMRTLPDRVHDIGGGGYLSGIIAVSGGMEHTVALRNDRAVVTWGRNMYGQLGDGTTTHRYLPGLVYGTGGVGFLENITAIGGCYDHTIALRSDSTVWAWGRNNICQLGDGTTIDRYTPVQVVAEGTTEGLRNIVSISGGWYHNLALHSDGTVFAWGRNTYGQVGDGTTTHRSTPIRVHGYAGVGHLTQVIAVGGAGHHSLAVRQDGTVWGWGSNHSGKLGDGTDTASHTPIQTVGGATGETFLNLLR